MADHDCKAEKCPKYLWPSIDRRMFNTPALDLPSDYIAVCEGEIDAITASQCGLPAVGIPGVSSWQDWWSSPLAGYDAVYVLTDHDDSGAGAGLARKISMSLPQARTVMMPEGHDVNSLVLSEGTEALRALIGLTR